MTTRVRIVRDRKSYGQDQEIETRVMIRNRGPGRETRGMVKEQKLELGRRTPIESETPEHSTPIYNYTQLNFS